MPKTDRTFCILLAVICLSFVLRIYAAATMGIAQGDEYGTAASAQSLAERGEFTGWTMRSYFYPILLAVFGRVFLPINPSGLLNIIPIYSIHGYWIFINRVFNVLLGTVGIFLTFKLGEACYGKEVGLLAAFLQGINCLDVFWGMRSIPDPSSTVFLLASLLFLVRSDSDRSRFSFLFCGILLGTSVMCRYSSALYGIPMVLIFLLRTEYRKGVWLFSLGVIMMVFLQGILDYVTWGVWFQSSMEFFVFNIVEGKSLIWGYKPFNYYYEMLPIIFGHTYPLLLLALERRDWKTYLLASAVALFLYAMSSIPHKELRFLLTTIPLVCILSSQATLDQGRSHRERVLLFLLVGWTVLWQFKRFSFFFSEDPSTIFV